MSPDELIQSIKDFHCPDFGHKDMKGIENYFKYALSPEHIIFDDKFLALEFGVFLGATTAMIDKSLGTHVMYGFDTFTGLPEDWTNSIGQIIQHKGFFDLGHYNATVPQDTATIKYVQGLIEDTYPKFLLEHPEPIQFIHVDVDLYNPVSFVLEHSVGRLKSGSVIIVDDIYNYNGWEIHAAKAFCEWVDKYDVKYEPYASCGMYSPTGTGFTTVAFKLTKDL